MQLKKVQKQLKELQAQEKDLQEKQGIHADNGNFGMVATIKAQLEWIKLRIAEIRLSIEGLHKRAEIERKFAEYEQLTQHAKAHYSRMKEIDDIIAESKQTIDALTKECSDMKADYHITKHARSKLYVELKSVDKSRLQAIVEQYRVEGYL